MIRVLVADDHDLVRMGIVRMLEDVEDIEVIGEAKSGEEAIEMARNLPINLILMDVKMPGVGGLEATRKILTRDNTIRVIAVSAMSEDLFPERLMKLGASGYITKDADFKEMVYAIRRVMDGNMYMSSAVAQQLALRNFDGTKQDSSPFKLLSERELQTAMMIATGTKVSTIADSLCVSPKTVNSYRYRIFEKLNIGNDVELTILAVKHKVLDVETLD